MSTPASTTIEFVQRNAIIVEDRLRGDMGDVKSMVDSIKEFGLIQPIVLIHSDRGPRLVAGGRRFAALTSMKIDTLEHGKHYVWREENNYNDMAIQLKMVAIELEENLRRKDMTWQEQVLGKKRLLEIMQKINGVAESGGRTREELRSGESKGFGVRKLAAMLGESPAATSQDLKIANLITMAPKLAKASSKLEVEKKFATAVVAVMQQANQAAGIAPVVPMLSYRVLVHVADEVDQATLLAELEARGYKCEAVIV